MTSYAIGRVLEYRTKAIFEKHGFVVDRRGASKPADLVVKRNGVVLFACECKRTSKKDKDTLYVEKEDVDRCIEFAKRDMAKPLLVVSFYRSPVYVFDAREMKTERKMIRVDRGQGEEIEEFLKHF